MKKVLTSVTMHTTSEGQRLSYTYSEVDEEAGTVLRDNIRQSLIVMPTEANTEVLGQIEGVRKYVAGKLEG